MSTDDVRYMRLAIRLALKAAGMTSPNPLVGAVIVKNNKVVGTGYHKKAGLPHAEIEALKQAGKDAKGSVLYVNLEPCDHFGRTPPCTAAIIRSGVKKVVVGMKDPNPINNGRGIRRLKKHDIKVILSGMEDEAQEINRQYIKFITKKMPYVTAKVAQTLDGKIATKTGDSKWISGEDSRRFVHALRSISDAVMVGANTVIKDDPLLLSNSSGSRQPVRVIVDGNSKIPAGARIFSSGKRHPVILASSLLGRGKKTDLAKLLKLLAKRNITNILVEGGGELIAGLIEKDLVDRMLIFIAPKVIGGRDAITSVEGLGVEKIKQAHHFKIIGVKKFKDDILIEARR